MTRNFDKPPGPAPGEGPAGPELAGEIAAATRAIARRALAWANAQEAIEATLATPDGLADPEKIEELSRQAETTELALTESLEELQQLAGIDVMLETFGNLENLVAEEEAAANQALPGPSEGSQTTAG